MSLRIVILFIALGAAGTAAWLSLSLQPANTAVPAAASAPPEIRMAEVLVASADIGLGRTLDATNVRWQKWPEDAVGSSYIIRSARTDAVESLSGSVVRGRFAPGEPILEEKLARTGSGVMAMSLPAGKRAVAIRVSAENTAGGFIVPGDRVDVIQTVTLQDQVEGRMGGVSQTILRNIRVLAIDQKAGETEQAPVIGKTATLELEPNQAEVVTAAQASGLLSLSLRSVVDLGEDADDNVKDPAADRQQSASVRILRAGQSEFIKVQ